MAFVRQDLLGLATNGVCAARTLRDFLFWHPFRGAFRAKAGRGGRSREIPLFYEKRYLY